MKSIASLLFLGIGAAALTASADADLSKLPPASDKKGLTFAKDIRPLIQASCIRCHGEQRPKGELRLTSLENLLKGGKDGKVVEPGKSQESRLLIAVARIDDETAMPPTRRPGGPGGAGPGGQRPGGGRGPGGGGAGGGRGPGGGGGAGGGRGPGGPPPKPLTPEQVGIVRAWIDQGAK